MRKLVQDIQSKSVKDLEKEIWSIRHDMAKTTLEQQAQPVKDSNVIPKKKKQLAILLTVLNDKNQKEESK